jgi:hypothetical protein
MQKIFEKNKRWAGGGQKKWWTIGGQKQKRLSTKKLKTFVITGGPSRDRTLDLLIKSQLLYQLS